MKNFLRTALNVNLFLVLLLTVASAGCSSSEPTNIADAPQSEIDKYNQLIEEEAKKVSAQKEDKNI